MKSSEQKSTARKPKSVQEVSKQKPAMPGGHAKTDVRYWQCAIFQPTYTRDGERCSVSDWAVKIQHAGQRETFSLGTPNKAAAANKAREIFLSLRAAGWAETLAQFKPKAAGANRAVVTVGEFLEEVREKAGGKARTVEDYCRAFRSIVADIFGIEGGRKKYDYRAGGRDAWLAKIHAVKLADVTPETVQKWKIRFLRRAGSQPVRQRAAKISVNSMLRQAKSLFAPAMLKFITFQLPDIRPFEGVKFEPRPSMRYRSGFDVEKLIASAQAELPADQLKIFLLAALAGLRRSEIDKLEWSAFRWNENLIRIEATRYFQPKSEDSAGDVEVDPELIAAFRGFRAKVDGGTVDNTIQSWVAGATVNLTGSTMSGTGTYHIISSGFNSIDSATTSTISSNLQIRKDYGSSDLSIDVGDGAAATDLLISGNIGEVLAAGVTKYGLGTMVLSGTNTYTGGTRIDAGTLTLGHATDTLANTGAINVNGGTLALGTNTDTVGAVTLTSGSITGSGAGTLTGSSYGVQSGSVSAKLGGSGVALTKTTAGTVTLTGTNTYTGATNVNDGTLVINGNISTSSLTTVAVGATLGGSGTVGKAIINGTLAVGNSPGQMNFTDTLGLNGNTIMEIDGILGAGVTGGHDIVNLTGAGAAGVLTYGGTMSLDMGVIFGIGNYSWNLFDMASETGTFTGITLADQYSGSLLDADLNGTWDLTSGVSTWTFTESTGVLGLTVVPEPRAALLGGLGLLMLLRRRRP